MYEKDLIKKLGFSPQEKMSNVYYKTYAHGQAIEIDFSKGIINYDREIKSDSKTTWNFSQAENFVVLECVDRLLTKGYNAKDITLEKVFPSGHGHSGRLDILVKKGKKSFLMIECKTWGKEFDKEFANIQKKGGQLFTYFQNDTNTDYLMLYASHFSENGIEYKSEIIKIENSYRSAGNVEDVYNRWNKISSKNGIFDDWVEAYTFQNKLLTKKDLLPLTEEDSGKIFNGFASILRKHSVSDKPNAFNKIFNLFLAKIYDEKKRDDEELHFQWKEGKDNPVDFEVRLVNLHTKGLHEFLRKEMEGIYDEDFEGYKTLEELYQKKKSRLKIDKILDIKEVFDDESFEDNFRVLKEVVQLLEKYQVRYPRRQRHLSDFFERLLTTGLKQEAGQYFTPVPITRFIVRSLPVREMIENALNSASETLPAVIDYAAGSGHFITDILETYQDIIDNIDTSNYYPAAVKKVESWRSDQYSWATHYIYGIEKDYRLVKVAKVGCYFYGDGLAQIFHADGLDNFAHSKNYEGLLSKNAKAPQFDIVVSNPPYSVDAFKVDLRNKDAENDFTLYKNLTDRSSEIESLFVERTAQLLKEGGIAGIVLPSSMLSNTGIYTKTREIILQKFDIIAIAELGSNTFMATGTNTVVLFLRRKNDVKVGKILETAHSVFASPKDITINGIENAVSTYLKYGWNGLSVEDYATFLQENPNTKVKEHPTYKEYRPKEYSVEDLIGEDPSILAREYAEKKLKQMEDAFWERVLKLESEKLFYFVLAYPQTIVLVKTGAKDAEKRFLGYEFSNRRGSEGIHPIERSRRIEDCTRLFDETNVDNPEKASAYIYRAFKGDVSSPVAESMRDNVFRLPLADTLAFDRNSFEKNLSLVAKAKRIQTKWDELQFNEVAEIIKGVTYSKSVQSMVETDTVILTADNITLDGRLEINKKIFLTKKFSAADNKRLRKNDIFICFSSGSKAHLGKVAFIEHNMNYFAGGFMGIVRSKPNVMPKYLYLLLNSLLRQTVKDTGSGANINNLSGVINKIKIPLPPIDVQHKIIAECEKLDEEYSASRSNIEKYRRKIAQVFENLEVVSLGEYLKIKDIALVNPSKKEFSKMADDTIVSFVEMASVSNNGYIERKDDKKFSELRKGSYTNFIENDIIIAKITPCMENGKIAIAYGLTNGMGMGSSEFHVIRCSQKLNNKFLFGFLNREIIRNNAAKQMTGTSGHRRVPASFYENLTIPVLPLAEQERIAREIEDYEAKIAKLKSAMDGVAEQKCEIVKKYL